MKQTFEFVRFIDNHGGELKFLRTDEDGRKMLNTYNFSADIHTNDGMKYRDEYNKILQTIPKHTLYEACLMGNKTALTIRDRVGKGELTYDRKE